MGFTDTIIAGKDKKIEELDNNIKEQKENNERLEEGFFEAASNGHHFACRFH